MTTRETLFIRDEPLDLSPTVVNLLIALLSLSIVAVLAGTVLVVLKIQRARRDTKLELPTHNASHVSASSLSPPTAQRSRRGHRRTVSITTHPGPNHLPGFSTSDEKNPTLNLASLPSRGGIPEIHITFPDEDRDVNEKRHSGRVVVVRISDNGGIGLAPYLEPGMDRTGEGLPPYQGTGEFMSLDLEKLGGLKEKGEKQWA